MDSTIRDNEQIAVAAKPVDTKGNAAQVQDPQWLSADTSKVTVDVDPANPLAALIKAVGPLTDAGAPVPVTFSADADLGDGVVPIQGIVNVNVIAGQAVTVNLEVGPPTPQP